MSNWDKELFIDHMREECTREVAKVGVMIIEFSEKIEFIGGSLGVSTGFESSTMYCKVLSQYMDIGLDLFQDMLLNPPNI